MTDYEFGSYLLDAEEEIHLPKFLKVMKELTDDPAYKNTSIARF